MVGPTEPLERVVRSEGLRLHVLEWGRPKRNRPSCCTGCAATPGDGAKLRRLSPGASVSSLWIGGAEA